MARAGLSATIVVEQAAALIDERGAELSLAALAERLGVRAPSLYKHVEGMAGLQRGVMLRAKRNLAAALADAAVGRSAQDAVRELAQAYRRWALAHPGQYPLTTRAPDDDDDDDRQASAAIADVVYKVLAGFNIQGDDAVDATRYLRAALHGFVDLETRDAFKLPVDLERSYVRLVEKVGAALSGWNDN